LPTTGNHDDDGTGSGQTHADPVENAALQDKYRLGT
jgi:hypothetical protein